MKLKNKKEKIIISTSVVIVLLTVIVIACSITVNNKENDNLSLNGVTVFDNTSFTNDAVNSETVTQTQTTINDLNTNEEPTVASVSSVTTNKAKKTTTTANQTTSVVTTTKTIPWGTSKDLNPDDYVNRTNAYIDTFDGVEVDTSLTPQNACWMYRINTFNNPKAFEELKAFAKMEYEDAAEAGNLNYNVPYRMCIKYEADYRANVGETYYFFYVLSML